MNKALLISMQPQHAINILNGKKILELRTWTPKGYKGWVYVYVSNHKPFIIGNEGYFWQKNKYVHIHYRKNGILNGKVAFRFWFDEYDDIVYTIKNEYAGCNGSTLSDWSIDSFYLDNLQLTYKDILDYGKGKDLYAWHIKQLEVFDKPKELSNFIVGLNYLGDIIPPTYKKLKKAPQKMQWVYVEK